MPITAPSRRNLQIYLDYQVEGLTQTQLAEKYNLTQCRISQILRRIDAWRSRGAGLWPATTSPLSSQDVTTSPPEFSSSQIPNPQSEISNPESPPLPLPSSPPPSSPSDFDLQLQHHRLNLVAREAIRHFQQPQATVTHKQGTRGEKSIDETTTRNLPKNLQCLKIILQANNQQQRLSRASSSSPPSPPSDLNPSSAPSSPLPSPLNSPLSRETVAAWLADQHRQAEEDEKVPFTGNSTPLAKDLLKLLLGESHNGLALCLLAAIDGKKVVNYSHSDKNPPEVPPYNGWYYAMYDAHGTVVAYLHADQVAHLLPPDYQPTLAQSGGLPRSHCPPLKILPLEKGRGEDVNLPLPLGEGRGEGVSTGSTSSTSASSTKFTQPQSPSPLTPLLPPITIFPPLLPA